jgi:hypothetical protein
VSFRRLRSRGGANPTKQFPHTAIFFLFFYYHHAPNLAAMGGRVASLARTMACRTATAETIRADWTKAGGRPDAAEEGRGQRRRRSNTLTGLFPAKAAHAYFMQGERPAVWFLLCHFAMRVGGCRDRVGLRGYPSVVLVLVCLPGGGRLGFSATLASSCLMRCISCLARRLSLSPISVCCCCCRCCSRWLSPFQVG